MELGTLPQRSGLAAQRRSAAPAPITSVCVLRHGRRAGRGVPLSRTVHAGLYVQPAAKRLQPPRVAEEVFTSEAERFVKTLQSETENESGDDEDAELQQLQGRFNALKAEVGRGAGAARVTWLTRRGGPNGSHKS